MPSYQTLPLVVTRLHNGALLPKQCETITRSGAPLGKSDRTYLSQACITRSRQSRDLTRREDLWPTCDVGPAGIVVAQLNDRTWPIHACRAALLLGVVSRPWQTVKVRVLSPERGAVSLRGRKHHAVRHSKAVMDRETRGL